MEERRSRIAVFMDTVLSGEVLDCQSAVLSTDAGAIGGAVDGSKNDQDCTNTSVGCDGSTNRYNCKNGGGCFGSTNTTSCQTLEPFNPCPTNAPGGCTT